MMLSILSYVCWQSVYLPWRNVYLGLLPIFGFLYTNDEKSESEIKETVPFTIATKRIKYLGINLSKETKDLYSEKYKILMKEMKDDINRWRNILCSWIGKGKE